MKPFSAPSQDSKKVSEQNSIAHQND